MIKESDLLSKELRQEAELRLQKMVSLLKRDSIDAILIASNANIYYASGRFFRGYVYVSACGKRIFFPMRPNGFRQTGDVIYIRKPEQIPSELNRLGLPLPASLGLERDSLSWSDCERLAKALPASEIRNASPLLREARMVKTPYEISLMKADGLHQAAAYHKITSLYKKDMTDVEFQVEIESVLRLEGNLGFSRVAGNLMEINLGSVISGANANNPSPYDFAMGGEGEDPSLPGGANGSLMHAGETVMVDMNCLLYTSPSPRDS